ncbi:phosphoenolpyruvate synthase [Patescibacteria group bacterium]|nr:phosphoenolpyruvate synthase [Patescibacteria group bacterium]
MNDKQLTLWFKEIEIEQTPIVGGKNASLGEMYSNLTSLGVNVPNGFAVTSAGYNYFISFNNLKEKISQILKDLDMGNIGTLRKRGKKIRNLILKGKFPSDLAQKIEESYKTLGKEENIDVAVRSSATAEDLPGASFAGEQETYLNIRGKKDLLNAVKKCFASLFTDRAISYRHDKGFDHFKVALSVGVQKMVRSDLSSSGVAFTLDPETGFEGVIVVNATYGLGELIVQGQVIPDEWIIFKEGLKKGYASIISRKLGEKNKRIIYSGKKGTKFVSVSENERDIPALTDKEVLLLANWCLMIENHFSKKYKKLQPMDIEWAKDGKTNELFIVQARPETVHSAKSKNKWEEYSLSKKGNVLARGIAIGTKIACGKARVIKSPSELDKFAKGEILITQTTDPDWEPIMKIASAIVTDKGGRTSHAAIVARELGIPCIAGAENATKIISSGISITVDCSSGHEGIIYEGLIPFDVKEHHLQSMPKTKIKIMANIGSPDEAFRNYFLPVRGVGLAREEFIITSEIKIHPNALIEFEKLKEDKTHKDLIRKIEEATVGYKDKTQFFTDKLASGIAKIAIAFWPYQVIVRFSDFKSNEYRGLLGGELYEPLEENPMIGLRGASRYYDPKFSKAFELELEAFKIAIKKFGISNIVPMIPFVRTVKELEKVIKIMEEKGLKRDEKHNKDCRKNIEECSHFRLYMMCEIPSNVVLADIFLDLLDGYSIGSNDLTQLTLGVDRDSSVLQGLGNENNEAVKILIREVIKKCKEKKKYIGLCGQGPSDSLEFAEFLVREGIDSISLNLDTIVKTTLAIDKIEA